MNDLKVIAKSNFLVLMDFSEVAYIALKYTIGLAKLVKGNIHVFHVANTESLVESDNPTVSLRAIESEKRKINNKLISIEEIIKAEGVQVNCEYSFKGSVNELEQHFNLVKPDLVVVGNGVRPSGPSAEYLRYLVNNYSGALLIIGKEVEFRIDTKISLGCNGNTLKQYDSHQVFEFDAHTKTPLTLFHARIPGETNKKADLQKSWELFYETNRNIQIEYRESSTIAQGLIEHISDQNIGLLCIGRGRPSGLFSKMFFKKKQVLLKVVKEVRIPVLVMSAKYTI